MLFAFSSDRFFFSFEMLGRPLYFVLHLVENSCNSSHLRELSQFFAFCSRYPVVFFFFPVCLFTSPCIEDVCPHVCESRRNALRGRVCVELRDLGDSRWSGPLGRGTCALSTDSPNKRLSPSSSHTPPSTASPAWSCRTVSCFYIPHVISRDCDHLNTHTHMLTCSYAHKIHSQTQRQSMSGRRVWWHLITEDKH